MAIGYTQKCLIERASSTTDAYGARKPTWHVVAEDVPCRLVEKKQQAPITELAERPISTRYTLLLPPRADLRVTDRVTVRYVDGTTYKFKIASVLARRQAKRGVLHISAELERVGS